MSRRFLLPYLIGLAAVSALASACTGPEILRSAPGVSAGARAPDFTLPEANGKPVTLSEFRGRAVLLYFSMGPG